MSQIDRYFEQYGPAYKWLATGTIMVATISVVLSATIVNVAIPAVMGAFGISGVQAQWISTGFLAAMTATMLLADWANRAFGMRLTMTAAMGVFLGGSVLGGLAPNETVLTLARVVQGAAAGVVQPLAMIMLFKVFPPDKRGAAMGIYGVGVVLAPAIGPWIGGVLMDAFDWRFVFYLGLPFAGIAIVLANVFLPTREESGPIPAFDFVGVAILSIFLAVLLSTLSNAQRLGWDTNIILSGFTISVAASIAFVTWEMYTDKPMLDMRLFANFAFSSAWVVAFIMGAGLFGSTYLLPVFVQQIQGMTPTQAGLLLMPSGFAMLVVFPIAGRLSDKVPPPVLIGSGMLVFAWASWLMAEANVHTAFWTLALWTVLSRVGLGLVFPAISSGALKVLPPHLIGQGSGASNFARQLGGAFGVNLLTVFIERRTIMHADALAATQTSDNSTTIELLREVAGLMHSSGLADTQIMPAATSFLRQIVVIQSSNAAFHDSFLVVCGIFLLALIPTWFMWRAPSPGA
ncbi:Multidrug resistance protein B (plasmid) [Tritonibacter mobilis]|uniref:DHA2 family efflux MFS transporter permease subunit n=1 Tax=Tritonibacter mobilis TaxID=379347 RepID=UPI000806DCCE|nr:DHA2 family efflux MFS transporter permease subunit [Tritonibacter mobilis]VCU62333.1 Multidrug resistance protein B [Tritonibacter mobilis]